MKIPLGAGGHTGLVDSHVPPSPLLLHNADPLPTQSETAALVNGQLLQNIQLRRVPTVADKGIDIPL